MPRINPGSVDRIKVLVRDAAYPSHMSMTLEALEIGSCRVQLPVKPEHFQPFGVVHGGVLATLIDTATFWAGFLSLEREDDGLANVDLMPGNAHVHPNLLRQGGASRSAPP